MSPRVAPGLNDATLEDYRELIKWFRRLEWLSGDLCPFHVSDQAWALHLAKALSESEEKLSTSEEELER